MQKTHILVRVYHTQKSRESIKILKSKQNKSKLSKILRWEKSNLKDPIIEDPKNLKVQPSTWNESSHLLGILYVYAP